MFLQKNIKKTYVRVMLLLGIIFLMYGAFLIDTPVHARVVKAEGDAWRNSRSEMIVKSISRYGDWPELMLFGLIAYGVARYSNNRRWQRIFLIAMLASTIAGGVANTFRLTTGRTRPRASPAIEQGWYGLYHEGHCLIGKSEFNSFPSGHTATAVGFAAVVFFASLFWGSIAMVIAIAIASSRLLLGAHHPSDLLAATILAFIVAWYCWSYLRKNYSKNEP